MKKVGMELSVANNEKTYFIKLPVSEEGLAKFINKVSNNGKDDYFISNEFNGIEFFGFNINEYDSLEELNKFVEHLNECDEYEHDLIMALIDWGEISSLKDVYEVNLDDYKLEYDLHSYEDVGKFFYEMNFGAIPPMMEDVIEEYFDFKKYGKDIMQDTFYSTFCNKGAVFCIG